MNALEAAQELRYLWVDGERAWTVRLGDLAGLFIDSGTDDLLLILANWFLESNPTITQRCLVALCGSELAKRNVFMKEAAR